MKKIPIAIIALFLLLSILAGSCRSSHGTRKQKEVARTQEQRKKETMHQYEAAVKRHKSIQTKETRKRLIQNEKEARRKENGRKQFFLFRWFAN